MGISLLPVLNCVGVIVLLLGSFLKLGTYMCMCVANNDNNPGVIFGL